MAHPRTALGSTIMAIAACALALPTAAEAAFFGSSYNTIVPSPGGNPSGSGCVTNLQSDLDGTPPYGYLTWTPGGVTTFSQLATLTATYSFPVGSYHWGSPRFEIPVDTDGDGSANGSIFVYLGTPPSFTDPGHTSFVASGNVIGDVVTHWDLTQFAGPYYGTYAQALALLGTGRVLDVEFVVDGGGGGDQAGLVDTFTVNNETYVTVCPAPPQPVPAGDAGGAAALAALLTLAAAWRLRRR